MHIGSMSLGIFDWLIGWIANFVGTVIGWVVDIIMGIVNRWLFNIAKQILFIVDWCQSVFRKLAGTDTYYYMEGGKSVKSTGDILFKLMSDATVLQVLLALSLVAVFMTIVATIIKVVQSEFTTEGSKNSKGAIIGDALKSFIKFALVPILCVGGVYISNLLLRLLDNATSLGGSSSMASQIFVSAASSANKSRNGVLPDIGGAVSNFLTENKIPLTNGGGVNSAQTAAAIDMCFRQQLAMKGTAPATIGGIVDTIMQTVMSVLTPGGGGMIILNAANTVGNTIAGSATTCASYQNLYMVTVFYDVGHMNMIILIGGSIVACFVMLKTAFGLVMRLFKAVILFMISPPVIAIAPLDKGNAFQTWRKQFISEVLGAYGAVIGLNLFFMVLPLINNINLFALSSVGGEVVGITSNAGSGATLGGYGGNILDDLAHLLFTIVGLYMVKDLIKLISNIAGGTDALAEGEAMAKKAGETTKKTVQLAGGAAIAAAGAVTGNPALMKMGMNTVKGSMAHFKGMAGEAGNGLLGEGTFNSKKTLDERKKYNEEKKKTLGAKSNDDLTVGEVISQRAGDGLANLFNEAQDFLNPFNNTDLKLPQLKGSLRTQALQEQQATNLRGIEEDLDKSKKQQAGVTLADTRLGEIAAFNTTTTDATVTAKRAEMEAELATGKYSEDEQTQQLIRQAIESLKNIESAQTGKRDSAISAATTTATTMKTSLAEHKLEVDGQVNILTQIQTDATRATDPQQINADLISSKVSDQVKAEFTTLYGSAWSSDPDKLKDFETAVAKRTQAIEIKLKEYAEKQKG